MFTGIVREMGEIISIRRSREGAVLAIRSQKLTPLFQPGHSVSIDGVCLTVTESSRNTFKVEATPETLKLSNLGTRRAGDPVNLEPPLQLSDFMGGHLVQGHVDGIGRILRIQEEGNSRIFTLEVPESVLRYCVYKGSLTVNGVSLTISGLQSKALEVTIIPHTFKVTNFSSLRVGDVVNLEADVISKYVESHVVRFVGAGRSAPAANSGGSD